MTSSRHPMVDWKVAGKWKVGRKLGNGSFGDVHLAVDITTGEEVAVKMV